MHCVSLRTCYDHLAGRLGVAIADALVRKRYVVLSEEGGELTVAGKRFLSGFGSVTRRRPAAAASSADPAWIGASAAITSPATWAPKYAVAVSNAAGSRTSKGHALSASPRSGGAACARSSPWNRPTCASACFLMSGHCIYKAKSFLSRSGITARL